MPRGRPRRFPSIAELQNMIRERRRHRSRLQQERKKLQSRMDQVNRELGMLDGGRGARGGRRNERPLPEVMEAVLKRSGKPMRVGDIAQAVQQAGYRSNSANFRGIVNQTLIKDKRFASASRGLYHLK